MFLLTIVPIPYISKDDVDLDQYLKENFGEAKTPKKMEDIKGVQIDVPALNIVPIPNISKDIDISLIRKQIKIINNAVFFTSHYYFNKYLKSKDFKFMYNKQQFYKHIIKNISKTVK